ncbi:MAG: 3-methyl-2-oxobutanoate hydroxymethyltransferase [Lentisphaeria bacterium]|nr:3-methyl-2-oxobutanoate hydroxymethyltransferase [Lentisphaeria bacterium]
MEKKKATIRTFLKMKENGEKIVQLTAYDAIFARLAEAAGVDQILVGDSLGNTFLGYRDTTPVTMDDMIHHCRAVRRGAPNTFIIGDMPFLSYQLDLETTLRNAARFMQEADCDCVKLETTRAELPVIRRLVEVGIPVMAHIGLRPQTVKVAGGYRIAGKSEEAAAELRQLALDVQDAGAFAVVLECIPGELARQISESLTIPTIGIGAGIGCDGQVQVLTDVLGLSEFTPRHAKPYAGIGQTVREALAAYADEVRHQTFPTDANTF